MKNNLNVVIIEDEIPAARLLHSMLCNMRPQWNIEVLPGNIEESVMWFASHPHPDLIFLDIQLSDGNSFDLLAKARPDSSIIFTTAYDEFAIRAFTVNSIDYILKPFDEQRLIDAIVKYETFFSVGTSSGNKEEYLDIIKECLLSENKKYRTRFLISRANKLVTLKIEQIAYFYSEQKIIFAVENNGVEHIIDISLDRLMEQLNPDLFYRANRQTIIHIDAIKKIEPYFNSRIIVTVNPPSKNSITISKEKLSSFKVWLNY